MAHEASNRLHRGEVHDFLEAVDCCEQACREERGKVTAHPSNEFWEQRCDQRLLESLDAMLAECTKARQVYLENIHDGVDAVLIELRAAGLRVWSACLENDDYTQLAI